MVRARYVFDESNEILPHLGGTNSIAAVSSDSWPEILEALQQDVVGTDEEVLTPFGLRRVVYSDYTASGRCLESLEQYIQKHVMPRYGNVHTLTTATARQSTFFRTEARRIVKQYFNLDETYAAIFCGAGCTAAVDKFVRILEASAWNIVPPFGADKNADAVGDAKFEDRWGSIECRPCKARLKSEAAYRAHCATDAHKRTIERLAAESKAGKRKVHILLDPSSHHSLSLPFREAAARPAKDSDGVEIEIVDLAAEDFGLSLSDLERCLQDAVAVGAVALCFLCAASNVTGARADVAGITARIHANGGVACWDIAGLAGHRRLDVRPAGDPLAHADVIFASPHKLLGGPSTPGLLLVRKSLCRNSVPAIPGGGTVFFVGPTWQSYITNCEEREEAGSPDLIASVRAGMVYHLHSTLPRGLIEDAETAFLFRLLSRLAENPRVEVLAPNLAASGCGIVSFVIRYGNAASPGGGQDNSDGGLYLHHGFVSCLLNDLFGVQSRAGCACAGPLAQKLLGIDVDLAKRYDDTLGSGVEVLRPGFTRVGVHFSDSESDAEIVREAICWVASHGWRLLPYYTFDTETGEWTHRQDCRDQSRTWLSAWRPPALARDEAKTPKPKAAPREASNGSTPKSFEELSQHAWEAAQRRLPSHVGAPVLRCEAELLWFALPQDAAWALSHNGKPALAPTCSAFADVAENSRRPHEPLFSARPAPQQDGVEETSKEDIVAQAKASGTPLGDNGQSETSSEICAAGLQKQSGKCAKEESPSGTYCAEALRPKLPKVLLHSVREAVADFDMIMEGDRVLVGLSGGKDSLCLLHALLELQRTAPVHFTVGAATVDPDAAGYDPSPLVGYLKELGVEYFLLEQQVMKQAEIHMDPKAPSICSFCARMKRGMLYRCMRENKYNVLALGQHLDDIAESFLMSAFFNGMLRTMKANYWAQEGDIRIIRPLIYLREEVAREAATTNKLPIIADNCPACFAAPKERHRMKLLLSSLEFEHKDVFRRILSTVGPLINISTGGNLIDAISGKHRGAATDDEDAGLFGPPSRDATTTPVRPSAPVAARLFNIEEEVLSSSSEVDSDFLFVGRVERAALLALGAVLGATALRVLGPR